MTRALVEADCCATVLLDESGAKVRSDVEEDGVKGVGGGDD